MKTAEIRELTVAEIKERIEAARVELNRLKLNHAVSPVENASVIRNSRRDIARMLTVLRQKETLN
ncbi:MAG: 50S ribosomal protein L29 [Alistipes sp.]|nr:50S ribosomal protein L29 [Alistipes sp.]MCD8172089.1 50S ribosomal protein L29 [Alistipes sp.]